MPRPKAEKEAWERQCYGCLASDIDVGMETFIGGPKMLQMSRLSDAQELILCGEDERARQVINQVKYMISKDRERGQ